MTTIGYARTSTDRQHLDLQLDALRAAGCETIYTEQMSGASKDRPELTKCLAALAEGDTLCVWRLDRLGRSTSHLLSTVEELGQRGVGFRSISDNVDTTSAQGRLVFHILSAMAEFERELIKERINAGVEAARVRGKQFGRPTALSDEKVEAIRQMRSAGRNMSEIARITGVSRATLYRHLDTLDA
jgi:DNA invertase Pin-like site-specific DNA recombinase